MTDIVDYYFDSETFIPELNLLYIGHQQCPPGHKYNAIRDHFIIHYIKKGTGVFRFDEKNYTLRPGCSFLIKPGQINLYKADIDDPWEYYWLAFKGRSVELLLAKSPFQNTPVYTGNNVQHIQDTIEKIYFSEENRSTRTYFEKYKFFFELFHYYSSSRDNTIAERYYNYILRAKRFIEDNFQKQINTQNIANYLGLNRSYFSHYFKQKTGLGFSQYLRNFRLSEAKKLLKGTDHPIKIICYSVGFYDYYHFLKTFKKHTGLTPAEYRRGSSSKNN